MNKETADQIRAHAVECYPFESCGLIVSDANKSRREIYVPCTNKSGNESAFLISGEDYARAEDLGQVIAVVHSHPDQSNKPTHGDLTQCSDMAAAGLALPWFIVMVFKDVGTGEVRATDIAGFAPDGWEAPLIGRQFTHGTNDCWRLIRDWWKRERGIEIPDFKRDDDWWDKGQNLYVENYQAAGFVKLAEKTELLPGDLIVMQYRAPVPNHGGVYVGNTLMLHHLRGYLSERVVYGGYWESITVFTARHESML